MSSKNKHLVAAMKWAGVKTQGGLAELVSRDRATVNRWVNGKLATPVYVIWLLYYKGVAELAAAEWAGRLGTHDGGQLGPTSAYHAAQDMLAAFPEEGRE